MGHGQLSPPFADSRRERQNCPIFPAHCNSAIGFLRSALLILMDAGVELPIGKLGGELFAQSMPMILPC